MAKESDRGNAIAPSTAALQMELTNASALGEAGMFILDPQLLETVAEKHHQSYLNADPFPHSVIDHLLPEAALERVRLEIPRPDHINWTKFDDARGKKLASNAEAQLGPATRLLLYQLNSSVFIEFLEKLTGIDGLLPDPYFWGGGVHQIVRGGFLKIHADFNRHPKLNLDRRLNVLVYLNRGWEEDWGGHLELWDREMTECRQKILPIFGRCVIFNTTDFSNHGHPDPIQCPEVESRKSIALYYYTNGRPRGETLGTRHSTPFRRRPGERIYVTPEMIAYNILPPILMLAVSSLKRRLNHFRKFRHARDG
jgi:Rps23 Pro-64 3,4-dihydroxylase Tpa1-like proline 4-hydroxylase